jgi:hypothetical protein
MESGGQDGLDDRLDRPTDQPALDVVPPGPC